MQCIITTINGISEFSNCQLTQTHNGKTIQFYYNNRIRARFFKNEDGFGGKQGGITCSLNVLDLRARQHIYQLIDRTPNLTSQFVSFLEIKEISES